MPGAGIEPARYFYRGILSPLRLPISPPGHRVDAVCRASLGIIKGHKGLNRTVRGTKRGPQNPII